MIMWTVWAYMYWTRWVVVHMSYGHVLAILSIFQLYYIFQTKYQPIMLYWKNLFRIYWGSIIWNTIPLYLMWCIWMEKNDWTSKGNVLTVIELKSLFLSSLFNWTRATRAFPPLFHLGVNGSFVILDPRQDIFLGNYQFLPERWRYIPLLSFHPAILLDMVFPVAPLFSNPSNSEWKYQYKQIHMISEWVIKISRRKEQ